MEPAGEPAQLLLRPRELDLRPGEALGRVSPAAGLRARRKGLRHLAEPPQRPFAQAALQPAALLIARRQEAPARGADLGQPGAHLGLQPRVGGGQPGRRRHGLDQPGITQHRGIVDQDRQRLAVPLDHGHADRPDPGSGTRTGRPPESTKPADSGTQ